MRLLILTQGFQFVEYGDTMCLLKMLGLCDDTKNWQGVIVVKVRPKCGGLWFLGELLFNHIKIGFVDDRPGELESH